MDTYITRKFKGDTMNYHDLTLSQSYNFHKQRLYSFVASLFEWELPPTCNGAILERDIITHGCAAIFWEPKFNAFINTKATASSNLDVYGIPKEYECLGVNYNRRMSKKGLAIVYDTLTSFGHNIGVSGMNIMNTIQHYARLLAMCDIGVRNEILNTQHPCVIALNDKSLINSAKEMWRQARDGEPVIIADKELFTGMSTQVFNLPRETFIEDKIATKRSILNEFLSDIGVDSMVYEKSERLTQAEGEVNKDQISLPLQNRLAPRLSACAQFEQLYGKKITCKPRTLNVKELYRSYGIDT